MEILRCINGEWTESNTGYGDMHGQGMDAVEFFVQKKWSWSVGPKSGVGNSDR